MSSTAGTQEVTVAVAARPAAPFAPARRPVARESYRASVCEVDAGAACHEASSCSFSALGDPGAAW